MRTSVEVVDAVSSKVDLRWRRADQVQKVFIQEKIQLVCNSTVGAEKDRGFLSSFLFWHLHLSWV